MPAFMRAKNRRGQQFEDNSCEISSWICWQCPFIANKSDELSFHLENCLTDLPQDCSVLSGCPYCPISDECHSKEPFNVHLFTQHVKKFHPEVEGIVCPYCVIEMKPVNLLRLAQHIMFYHKIFWRPSPYTLAHLRMEQVQREIICTGCGFTTHMIIDKDQVTPPPSFLTHVQICSQNGASLTEQRCISEYDCDDTKKRVMDNSINDCTSISIHFGQRFPFSRGFITPDNDQMHSPSFMNIKELPESVPELCDVKFPSPFVPNVNISGNSLKVPDRTLQNPSLPPLAETTIESLIVNTSQQHYQQQTYQESQVNEPNQGVPYMNQVTSSEGNIIPYDHPFTTETGESILLPTLKEEEIISHSHDHLTQTQYSCDSSVTSTTKKSNRRDSKLRSSLGEASNKVAKFDVPLNMPPEPPNADVLRKKKNPDGRVFVCPTCGCSTFLSLRERDEHMEKEHNGELVFPCQLCGMAYPLYIALRRHAVLKHSGQFDSVLYGLIPENEPNECPKCRIVAFSDPVVLKMHLAVVHNFDADEKPKKASRIKTTESEEEYAPTPDEDREEEHRKKLNSVSVKKVRPKTRGRGRPPMISSLGTFSSRPSTTPLRRNHEDDELYSPSRSYSSTSRSSKSLRRRSRGGGSLSGKNAPTPLRGRKDPTVYSEKTRYERICEKTAGLDPDRPNLSMTALELKLADVSPSSATTLCAECHLEVQNHRELLLHNELEHNSQPAERHMGCSVCGRVFFGQHGKFDLIGHLKISHQLQQGQDTQTERPFSCNNPSCEGLFTSVRLKGLHQCPIRHLPGHFIQSAQCLTNYLGGMPVLPKVLATELIADQAGYYILAYGCPDCGYIFTGDTATLRYVKHRKEGACNMINLNANQ